MELYKSNRAMENPGLAPPPAEVQYEHVHRTSHSKMGVALAAQVSTVMCTEDMYILYSLSIKVTG